MMSGMDIRLHLDGPERQIGARQALEAARALLELLDAAGRAHDEPIEWTLAEASHGSFDIAYAPLAADSDTEDRAVELSTRILAGIEALREQAAIPAGFTSDMVRRVRDMAVAGGRVRAVSLQADGGTPHILDAVISDNAQAALQGRETSVGSATGRLDKVNLRGRSTVSLIDTDTDEPVECKIPEQRVGEVLGLINHEVEITGRLFRDASGHKRKIEIWHIEPLEHEPPEPISNLIGVLGTDWTGGISSTEFVRRQRGAG